MTIRDDLYCPECGSKGMTPLSYKAESGRTRYRCKQCKFRTTSTIYTPPQILPKLKLGEIRKHKRFLIVSAVNDTPVVKDWLNTLLNMCDHLNAMLLVIPGVYKNPDLKHQGVISQYKWPDDILPYVCNTDVSLNKNLVIRGTTRIQYTAINPLSGMNSAGDTKSEVFGHPQVARQPVATPHGHLPKVLMTTGSVSQPNYGGSKQAKKAAFHHSLSATLIELEGDTYYDTQVHYDGEGAYLFNKYYTATEVLESEGVAAIIHGDTHIEGLPEKLEKIMMGVAGKLAPDYEVFHDLHTQDIGSHHTEKNTLHNLGKSIQKKFSIRDELMLSVRFLRDKVNPVVVDSNHHRHLDQWFNRFKPNGGDHVNLELYYELGEMAASDLRTGGDGNLFRLFVEKYAEKEVQFVGGNDYFIICDIDCSQHGDRGPNGSRGSAKSYSKTGYKTFVGHAHTAIIEKGCYQVGASHLNHHYAVGYGTHTITHGIIYDNGKRGLFSIINDKLSPLMRRL